MISLLDQLRQEYPSVKEWEAAGERRWRGYDPDRHRDVLVVTDDAETRYVVRHASLLAVQLARCDLVDLAFAEMEREIAMPSPATIAT